MARREITQYYDDLDNTPIEAEELHVIRFSMDGNDYVLDLSKENAQEFHETLAPFIKAARQAPSDVARRVNPREVRKWAQSQGMAIAHRGKIPFAIIDAYNEAHA
ncbi:Lsr2 family protein [Corynebacterium breve]|uniref:Lsr2 family protein n=1 Tax=Corynebacterium breve TaxID=3049799 RepID=A0ABY8VD27_9CORY|nr:Lsr2 family protein [Corynebacterium breve]WIM67561.1 Lsr2 family protein [Corynebacterium breve]